MSTDVFQILVVVGITLSENARMRLPRRLGLATLLLTIFALASTARAADPVQLLDDFVHYSLTGQVELAKASGDALLDSGISDAELANIVDDDPSLRGRLVRALRWSREVGPLEPLAAQIEMRVEIGRLDQSRDEARIEEAIPMLGGTRRERQLGAGRLLAAGEHAVPAILRALDSSDLPTTIRHELMRLLPGIGREAVNPLAIALPHLPPDQQVLVANTLAQIGYPHAVHALLTLHKDEAATAVTGTAAADALHRLGSGDPATANLAAVHADQARRYLAELEHLRSRPVRVRGQDGDTLSKYNIWQWDPSIGLVTQTVPEDLFFPIMAARHAHEARTLAPKDRDALAVFVAANLRLAHRMGEHDLSQVLPELDRSPTFYATVHGPTVARDVLAMALDQHDNELALDALKAMSRVAGSDDLLGGEDREPLVEALAYDDPRVRYEAALVAASAMPTGAFTGSERVVSLLGRAALGGAGRMAAVAAADETARHTAVEALEKAGYRVVAVGSGLDATLPDGGTLDLVWIELAAPQSSGAEYAAPLLESLGMPVLMVLPEADLARARPTLDQVPGLTLMQSGTSAEGAANVLMEIAQRDELSESDRRIYAGRALRSLRSLATMAPGGLSPAEAMGPLGQLVRHGNVNQQLLAGEVLASMDNTQAQRLLVDAAVGPDAGEDRDQLLDLAASSVRRFGDYTTRRQREDLLALLKQSEGAESEAAARLQGSLASDGSTSKAVVQQ